MSFLKYADNPDIVKGNGRGPLSFSRAHIDGLPFRGQPVMLKEEEYQAYTETVYDGYSKIFDLSNPEEADKVSEIIDRSSNDLYKVLHWDHHWVDQPDGTVKLFVYVVWVQMAKEINKARMPTGLAGARTLSIGNSK